MFPDVQKWCCKGNRWTTTIYWSAYPQWEQNETQKSSYGWDWLQKAYDMILQSWIIDSLKTNKISDKVIRIIEKNMKNWKMELTADGKCLAKVKIKKGISQGDILSPLLFFIAMMPLNHIPRKCTGGHKLTK